jgi:ribosome-associated heat shock protein Hsp15
VSATEDAQRLDRFLWQARFCKSRSLAAALVAGGRVRLNARPVEKPAQKVRPDDVLTLVLAGRVRVIRILALPRRRGPSAEAALLWADLEAGEAEPAAPLEVPIEQSAPLT